MMASNNDRQFHRAIIARDHAALDWVG